MTGSTAMSFGGALCTRCGQGFAPKEEMVNSNGEIWHTKCFVESGRAANPALGVRSGVGAAAESNRLVMGIERLDVVDRAVGLQESRFPLDDYDDDADDVDDGVSETGSALESVQGDFAGPEGEMKWHDSGFESQQMVTRRLSEEKRGEDVDVVLGLKESPGEPRGGYEEKPGKSGLKRHSSLQEARRRFQDIEEDANRNKAHTAQDSAVANSAYKYESSEVDTTVIRKRKSQDQRNGRATPLSPVKEPSAQPTRDVNDIDPIYQPYKKPEPPSRSSQSPPPRPPPPSYADLSPPSRSIASPIPPERSDSSYRMRSLKSPVMTDNAELPFPERYFTSPVPPEGYNNLPHPERSVASPAPPDRSFMSPIPPEGDYAELPYTERSVTSPLPPEAYNNLSYPERSVTSPIPPDRSVISPIPEGDYAELPYLERSVASPLPPEGDYAELPYLEKSVTSPIQEVWSYQERSVTSPIPDRSVISPIPEGDYAELPYTERSITSPLPPEAYNNHSYPERSVTSPIPPEGDYAELPYPERSVTSPIPPDNADLAYHTSFKQTERQDFETEEETLSKFPTSLEFSDFKTSQINGRPPTEYVNGPPVTPVTTAVTTPVRNPVKNPVAKQDAQQDYDGGTLRAQSGGQQRSLVSGQSAGQSAGHSTNRQVQQDYDGSTLRAQSGGQQRLVTNNLKPLPDPPTKGYPLPERPMPQFGSKMICYKCERPLELDNPIVNYNGSVWHPGCFVCVQCFQPFPEGIFYEYEGRKYCEHDFHMLFAPCCGACGEFVVGRVIKAMNANWHPHCFLCELCNVPLADAGFYKNVGRALCKECNNKEKAAGMGKYVCHKCHQIIEEGHIKFKGEAYHPYHFNCTNCNVELNADSREKGGELFCLRCHDKMGIPICGACRRPIEERVVHALGKTWHVEHFVCAKCEKPFLGARHYEKRGLAYCEIHYHQLFGNMCFLCNNVIAGDVFSALNKAWCTNHFACYLCDKKLSQKNKFFEFDLKPVCKVCYEHFPSELKKRMKKAYEQSPKK